MDYIYCTIAKSGKTFTAYFKNGNKSGYSLETFQDVPAGVPLIDYRTADRVKLMKAIFATDGPSEATGYGIPLVEYLEVMRGTGATITTTGANGNP